MSAIASVDLGKVSATDAALDKVPASLARRLGVLPLAIEEDRLLVVLADPDDPTAVLRLEGHTGLQVEVLPAAKPEGVAEAIKRYYPITVETEAESPLGFLRRMISRAVQIHCSDIHLDPEEERGVLRMRVDGMMREVRRVSKDVHADLINAVKVAADLDISEKRLPQDGQMDAADGDLPVRMRVAIAPTLHGEKATLRLLATLATSADLEHLDKLGMSETHHRQFLSALDQSHGVVLLSGPTGSGKTTTLYAALRHLRAPGSKHLVSIENPVEVPVEGVNQLQVDEQRFTFARALRSVLRHDPDVIMIGEIRDGETADIAVKSSLTGHLVLATLHANSSVAVITRLLNLGIAPELAASTLRVVLAQRLVRQPCAHCARFEPAGPLLRSELGLGDGEIHVPVPAGCPLCGGSGYSGRLGLYEMIPVDRGLRELILRNAGEDLMADHAFQTRGYRTLLQDGAAKIAMGLTTPEEVRRVTCLGEMLA